MVKFKNMDEMKQEISNLKKEVFDLKRKDGLRLKDWNELSKKYSILLKENHLFKKNGEVNPKDIVLIKKDIQTIIGCINILGDKIRSVRKDTKEIINKFVKSENKEETKQ